MFGCAVFMLLHLEKPLFRLWKQAFCIVKSHVWWCQMPCLTHGKAIFSMKKGIFKEPEGAHSGTMPHNILILCTLMLHTNACDICVVMIVFFKFRTLIGLCEITLTGNGQDLLQSVKKCLPHSSVRKQGVCCRQIPLLPGTTSNLIIKLADSLARSAVFIYLCIQKKNAVPRLVAGVRERHGRKVRAAQGAPLLKVEAIGDSRRRQKKTTAMRQCGKGEKAV